MFLKHGTLKVSKFLKESSFIRVTKPRLTDFHGGLSSLYRACEKVVPSKNQEIIHLEIILVEALLSGIKTLIASVYIPPNKDKYLLSLDRLLQNIYHQPNLILIGDFNCMDLVLGKVAPKNSTSFQRQSMVNGHESSGHLQNSLSHYK